MSRPHIVHFSAVHSIDDIRVFWKECRSLSAAGYRVTLIARGDASDFVDGVSRLARRRNVRGGRLGRMVLGTAHVTWLAWQESADAYHFHGPELIPHGLLMKLLGKAVVYDAHENFRHQILQKEYLPGWVRGPIARMVGILEDFAIDRFDGVVAATPRITEQLRTDHTVSITNYPVVCEQVQSEGQKSRVPGSLIYVGGVSVIRGIREMVRAMELVNQVVPSRLTICGEIGRELQEGIQRLQGWQYVDVLGWQSRVEVLQRMAESQIGLCVLHPAPNHVESIPNKLFEYMEAGLPVVASDFLYWRQFVEETGAGVMVDPLDPQSIADGILAIISDPECAERMGKAGATAVRDRFNWDSEAEKLIGLYNHILERPGDLPLH